MTFGSIFQCVLKLKFTCILAELPQYAAKFVISVKRTKRLKMSDEELDETLGQLHIPKKLLEATTGGFRDRSKRRLSLPLASIRDSRKSSIASASSGGNWYFMQCFLKESRNLFLFKVKVEGPLVAPPILGLLTTAWTKMRICRIQGQ